MNILETLGIETLVVTPEHVLLQLDVTDKVMQPFGLVHGGMNALLAETSASLGGNVCLSNTDQVVVGVDLQTHHLRPVRTGTLLTEATPLHIGKTLQTWQVKIHEQTTQQLTSFSTVTLAVIQKP